jgi:3-oxoacyl-[acyl-carrier protein] reductase
MQPADALTGKVAFVTGGAGGIGAAICEALSSAGAMVNIGFNRSANEASSLAARIGIKAIARHAPVTDSAALAAVANAIEAEQGRLDILVNCAGTTRFVAHSDLDALDDALIDEILATNVRGAFAATRACRRLLSASGAGVVINISSIAAQTAMGSNVMYCASKAALDNMTKSLARALAPGIRVLSVSPGLVDTEFVKSLDPAWRNEQVSRTPMQRLTTPTEVAMAVLASITMLTFSTGTAIAVDGGRPLA